MKSTFSKYLVIAIVSLLSGINMVAADYVHLASKGALTPYSTFAEAMTAAADNDTIYLSNLGTLDITITKPVVVIGAKNTGVNITIQNPDSTYIFKGNLSIEGIQTGNIIIAKNNIENLTFKNCKSSYHSESAGFFTTSDYSYIDNLIIDRCNIHYLNLINEHYGYHHNIKNAYVRNSVLMNIYSNVDASDFNLYNCYIYNSHWASVTLINCIYENGVNDNAIKYSSHDVYGDGDYSEEHILEKGYLGNDGTAAGPYGGPEPHYSLNPDYPTADIEKSSVEYDKAGKKLNIKVTVLHD